MKERSVDHGTLALILTLATTYGSTSVAVGETTILTFSPAASLSNVSLDLWEEQGFRFSRNGSFAMASHGKDINDYYQDFWWPANGTDYFAILSDNDEPVTNISRVDDNLFRLLRIDLAEYSSRFQNNEVSLLGIRSDFSTVTVTFVLDGVMDGDDGAPDFQTFSFPPSFDQLRALRISSQGFAMDNVEVNEVPEPGIMALLIPIGFLFCPLKRRTVERVSA